MSGTNIEVRDLLEPDALAEDIAYKYSRWSQKRVQKEEEWKELRNYLFATDTTTTSNSTLPWKNKTTMPKLTQIRDNLHANYMNALFPNDEWMIWEGDDKESVSKEKRQAITAYMKNKVRMGGFRKTVSRLLYDYIDYGNVIADVEYVHEKHYDPASETEIDGYIGPRAIRRSPLDVVFNPLSPTFNDSPKIIRVVYTMGELKKMAEDSPEKGYLLDVVTAQQGNRRTIMSYDSPDRLKSDGFIADGFDTIQDYYESGHVELLEFVGDLSDEEGNLRRNRLITIMDRCKVVRDVPNPSWTGSDGLSHVGWRLRPDNLYAMGPLDNLVGMQYRIDHLENIKADLFDFVAHPPLKIRGNVEAFDWEPFVQIELGEDGDVEVLKVDTTALQADTQIAILEQRMEEMAGAPREAMGIRSPGEKTAFEVQRLDDKASRIFQEKINQFEVFIIEPLLNDMLELARRNLNYRDKIRVLDDDIGVARFMDITREDISAIGKLRAKGSLHFAARNLLVQNLNEVFNSKIIDFIAPDVKKSSLSKLIEEAFGWERFELFAPDAAIKEQAATQREQAAQQDQLETEQMLAAEEPLEGEFDEGGF
jgi:hypothetical protein